MSNDNLTKAEDLLRTAKTVSQWNEIRAEIKDTLTVAELNRIDASGFIVKVLGKD